MYPAESTIMCCGCDAAPAFDLLEIEWNFEWVAFPVCEDCLTRAQTNARIEE